MTAAKSAPGQGPKLTVIDSAQAGSPGQRLVRARTQRNLTLDDVAKNLNLSVSMVKAIESDNFKSLPGRAFVKGYLRNYAKLVGIAPEDLIKTYEHQFGGAELELTPPEVARPARWIAPLIKGVGYLVVLAIVVGIGSVIYQNVGFLVDKAQQLTSSLQSDEPLPSPVVEEAASAEPAAEASNDNTVKLAIPLHPVENGTDAVLPAAEPAVAPAEPQPPVTADTPPSDSRDAPAATGGVPPQSSLDSEASTAASAVNVPIAVTPVVDGAASAMRSAPMASAQSDVNPAREDSIKSNNESVTTGGPGAASVSLNFSGKSWVQVRDASGKAVFNGTRAAGEGLQLTGQPPLKVTIGDARFVKISFNGKPYDFDFSSRNNVAQFTLGDE